MNVVIDANLALALDSSASVLALGGESSGTLEAGADYAPCTGLVGL